MSKPGGFTIRNSQFTILPYAVFLILSLVSWNRWIEPYVDSGRELMVPWRIAQGERLYRDVAFYHGPLGPFLAAGVDRLAGHSLAARTLLCAAIALLHLEGLRRLAGLLASPRRAALAVVGHRVCPGSTHRRHAGQSAQTGRSWGKPRLGYCPALAATAGFRYCSKWARMRL